jgi:hypothetical protein
MSDADRNRLKRFFHERGISISAGIRMVVTEYLRNNVGFVERTYSQQLPAGLVLV